MKILIATGNQGKLEEYKKFFADTDIEFVSLSEVGITDEAPEDKDTLQGNSLQKAQFYGDVAQMISVADDTGLFVDALGGRPGVYSSRYAENEAARNQKLLGELSGVEGDERSAEFRLVTTIYYPETGSHESFEGHIKGFIAEQLSNGPYGHGYDPLFYVKEKGKTFADMTPEEKGEISHRGLAFNKLKKYLITNEK